MNQMTLGRYLESIRKDRNITQREVANAVGIPTSAGYISQIEQGKIRKPASTFLVALAKVYCIDSGNLLVMAGYGVPVYKDDNALPRTKNAFEEHWLTLEEEEELCDYLEYMRARDK